MGLLTYTIQDLIQDKIRQIEFGLNSIEAFRSPPFDLSAFDSLRKICKGMEELSPEALKDKHNKLSYDPPPLLENFGFVTWKEFRASRTKLHIKNKTNPTDDFPIAGFSLLVPGAIAIIEDDFNDLLHVLKHKKLETMHADYVSSIFFAIDLTDSRLHYIWGALGEQVEFHTKRTRKSTESKRNIREIHKVLVLKSFMKLQKQYGTLDLSTKNRIAEEIMESLKTRNTQTGAEEYPMKISKIKGLLEELHNEQKISLPGPREK